MLNIFVLKQTRFVFLNVYSLVPLPILVSSLAIIYLLLIEKYKQLKQKSLDELATLSPAERVEIKKQIDKKNCQLTNNQVTLLFFISFRLNKAMMHLVSYIIDLN